MDKYLKYLLLPSNFVSWFFVLWNLHGCFLIVFIIFFEYLWALWMLLLIIYFKKLLSRVWVIEFSWFSWFSFLARGFFVFISDFIDIQIDNSTIAVARISDYWNCGPSLVIILFIWIIPLFNNSLISLIKL